MLFQQLYSFGLLGIPTFDQPCNVRFVLHNLLPVHRCRLILGNRQLPLAFAFHLLPLLHSPYHNQIQKMLPILSHSNGSRMNREDPLISYHLRRCAMRFSHVFMYGVNKWYPLVLLHLLFISISIQRHLSNTVIKRFWVMLVRFNSKMDSSTDSGNVEPRRQIASYNKPCRAYRLII